MLLKDKVKKIYSFCTPEDIETIFNLEVQYSLECKDIADILELEGHPSHGSKYCSWCKNVRKNYDKQINEIIGKYKQKEEVI